MTAALCSVVQLNVYDDDGSTLRGSVVADAGSLQWSDLLGEVGSASLTAKLLQTALASAPTLLDGRAICKIATNQTTDPLVLTEFFGFLVEGGEVALVGDQEAAGEQRSLQCRGLLALFDDAVVFPENGFSTHGADHRAFGPFSKVDTHGPADSEWDGTINATKWKDVTSTSDRYKKPKGWPDPNAYWVGCGSKEKQYFKTTINVGETIPVRISVSADENLWVYWDSELIIKNKSDEVGYEELNHKRLVATVGAHTLGIKFLKEWPTFPGWSTETWYNGDIDKMIASIVTLHPNGDTKDVLRRSTAGVNWLACQRSDGERPPTWNAAQIIGQLVDEAIERGVQSMSRVTLGFNDATDTDGKAWQDLHERSFPIGTKYTQVLQTLGELDIDWDVTPSLTLNGYRDQGSDVSDTVALVKGASGGSGEASLLDYKAAVTPPTATTMLVRAHNRWLTRSDADAEAISDRRENFLSTGGSLSREQARHAADRALDDMSLERVTCTGTFLASDGVVPYRDFGKGDVITAYDRYMNTATLRVVSISGAVPDEGPIRWTVELETPVFATAPVDLGTGLGDRHGDGTVTFVDTLPAGYMVVAAYCQAGASATAPTLTVGGHAMSSLTSGTIASGVRVGFLKYGLTDGTETSASITFGSGFHDGVVVFYLVGPKTTNSLVPLEWFVPSSGFPWTGTRSRSRPQGTGYVPEYVLTWAAGFGTGLTATPGGDHYTITNGTSTDVSFFIQMAENTTSGNTDSLVVTNSTNSVVSAGIIQLNGDPTA